MAIWKSNVFGKYSPKTLENLSNIKFIAVNVGISFGETNTKVIYIIVYTNRKGIGGLVSIITCNNSNAVTNNKKINNTSLSLLDNLYDMTKYSDN